jgi:hypothetical protein
MRAKGGLPLHAIRLALAAAIASLGVACHTISFEVGEGAPANVVEERKSFWFWGLTPTHTVDVRKHCPAGAVAISEETTFLDGLLGGLTFGIWAPRSSYYHCAPVS